MHLREHKNDDNKMNVVLLSDINSPNSLLETIEKASEKPIVNKDEERKNITKTTKIILMISIHKDVK